MDSTPTPSEKPVSKRRTPPAWPAYHGENPTCAHRQIEAHNFFAQMRIGNRIHYTTETMWCLGPVIATEPETPSYIPNLSTDGQQKPCDARCGHNNHRIGCLNDPASEATVSDVAEAIYSAFGEERGLARRPKPLRVAYEVAAKAAIKAFVASKLKAEAT